MDFFATFLDIAGLPLPKDRIFDSQSLKVALTNGTENSRPVFFYRGNLLYAVRQGNYKMHLWTWTTPVNELQKVVSDMLLRLIFLFNTFNNWKF